MVYHDSDDTWQNPFVYTDFISPWEMYSSYVRLSVYTCFINCILALSGIVRLTFQKIWDYFQSGWIKKINSYATSWEVLYQIYQILPFFYEDGDREETNEHGGGRHFSIN